MYKNFKDSLLQWLGEITLGSKNLYYKVRKDDENIFSIYLYTNKYEYCISCNDNYLGCTCSCRKSRAGEDWVRGHDLPDGKFNVNTWESIKNGIIKNELEQVCVCDACSGKGFPVDEIGEL